MYKMKSDINFSLTHEMLENAENERIHTSYAQEKQFSNVFQTEIFTHWRIPIIHSQQLFTER